MKQNTFSPHPFQSKKASKILSIVAVSCVFLVVILTGCSGQLPIGTASEAAKRPDEVLDKLTPVESLDTLHQADRQVVYFGRGTCAYCRALEPVLFTTLEQAPNDILYFNTDYWREKEGFETTLEAFGVDGVPFFAVIENGMLQEGLTYEELKSAGSQEKQVTLLLDFFTL